jgi:antitoxin component YwqK of YwqJK toxin-antitoxin module
MNYFYKKVLLLFYVLLLASNLSAQNGGSSGGNGYVPDWLPLGETTKPEKAEPTNYVSDWQMFPDNEGSNNVSKPQENIQPVNKYVVPWEMHPEDKPVTQEVRNSDYVSDWQMFPNTPESKITETPKDIIEAEELYFSETKGTEEPVEELYQAKQNPKSALFGIKETKINNKITVDPSGIKHITEYYNDGRIHRTYSIKDGKLEGSYDVFSNNGNKIISCSYSNGKLYGLFHMYYSETGNLRKTVQFKNGIKTYSTEYDKNGVTVVKEITYKDNGDILSSTEYLENKVKSYTDYGFNPKTWIIKQSVDMFQTPNNIDGKKFETKNYVINRIKAVTGANIPADYSGDELLWYVEQALRHIISSSEDFRLTEEVVDLIFADNMIFAMEHLARKFELAGDINKALDIRYEIMLLGCVFYYNNAKYGQTFDVEYFDIISSIYNRLNINLTTCPSTDMLNSLAKNNIVSSNNKSVVTLINTYNNVAIKNASKSNKAVKL